MKITQEQENLDKQNDEVTGIRFFGVLAFVLWGGLALFAFQAFPSLACATYFPQGGCAISGILLAWIAFLLFAVRKTKNQVFKTWLYVFLALSVETFFFPAFFLFVSC